MEQVLGRITRPYRRRNGQWVPAEAVSIVDEGSNAFHVVDVINRYAPQGMAYREGAVIGKGLCDLLIPGSEPLSAFRPSDRKESRNGIQLPA
jgi:hypothetical protein